MLAMLVCIVLVTLITLSLIKLTLAQRAQAQRELWRMQAEWLVDSGIDRAAVKIGGDAAYAGESWSIPALEFGGRRSGEVQIVVQAVDGQPSRRLVRVQAVFPADTDQRAKSSKQVTIDVPKSDS